MKLISVVLGLTYLLVSQPFFHVHEDEHEHHLHEDHEGAIHQTDDCHNFIYHGVTHSGSHDHDHATTTFQKCFTCQFFQSNPTWLNQIEVNTILPEFDSTIPAVGLHIPVGAKSFNYSLRGPPLFA